MCPVGEGELGPHLAQCGLGRGLPPYQVTSNYVIPFLVPRRKARLTPAAGVPCSNAANTAERKTWM